MNKTYTHTNFLLFCFSLALLFLFAAPHTAHAGYLDPGSGSSFVQGLIAIFAFFGRIIDKIKSIFGFKKENNN